MNINLFIETILILFAILASNGIIYSLSIFNLKTKNSSENISVITNSSEKDGLSFTWLIASNPIRLISSESSTSQTLSVTSSDSSTSQTLFSSESSASQTLSVTSSQTNVSQDIFDSDNWLEDSEVYEGFNLHTENGTFIDTSTDLSVFDNTTSFTSLDSITILNTQSVEQWREIAIAFHDFPINTPAGILQNFKFEELMILYSQDMVLFGITQTELRLIIEHLPAMSLFKPEINHLILTIMSYYHL
jgi:hypothetical protein